jgi:HEAT repeat protein
VFDISATWSKSADPLKRARGVDVLAQLGKIPPNAVNSFPDESYAIVSELVQHEKDIVPLNSAIAALGHLDNDAAVPLIAQFHDHQNANIRFSVACSLGSFPNSDLSVSTLLILMEDSDSEIRDWATFGLGVLGVQDSPEIRDALFRRLTDEDENVREEAMVGLGKRKDRRVLPILTAAVQEPEIDIRVAEAASLLLGMESDPEDWGAEEYRTALKEHFPNEPYNPPVSK